MKKLVVVGLVTVAAVFAAQANQVKWSYTDKFTSSVAPTDATQDLNGYTAYLILASDWTDNKYETLTANAIASATINLSTSSNTKGVTTSTYQTGTQVSQTDKATATGADFYVVISDNDGKNFYAYAASGDITVTGANSGSQVGVGKTGANALTQNQFTSNTFADYSGSGGVPEPTSGILLLVGGAMLALRRKRK